MKRRLFLKRASGLLVPLAFPCILRGQDEMVQAMFRNAARAKAAGSGGGSGLSIIQAAMGATSNSASSVAVPISPAAGNLLVVCIASFQHAASGVTDNIGSGTGWINIGSSIAAGDYISMWYKANIPSGITAVTASSSSASSYPTCVVHEVSGASASGPFTTGEYTVLSGGAATTNPIVGPLTNGTARSIMFAALSSSDSANPVTMGINGSGTVGTWSLFSSANCQDLDAVDYQPCSVPNIILSSSTSEKHGWKTNKFAACAVMAAFHV
jgi:hypothetical protein